MLYVETYCLRRKQYEYQSNNTCNRFREIRIENENGTAIKFPDGTLICTKTIPWTTAINSQLGQVYYTPTPTATGNYAVSFIEKPVVQITVCASGGTAAWYWCTTEPTATTGPNVGLLRPSSAEAKDYVYNINLMAIGRWK